MHELNTALKFIATTVKTSAVKEDINITHQKADATVILFQNDDAISQHATPHKH
jgi:hypothetical protein